MTLRLARYVLFRLLALMMAAGVALSLVDVRAQTPAETAAPAAALETPGVAPGVAAERPLPGAGGAGPVLERAVALLAAKAR